MSVTTSMMTGRLAANARARAGAISAGFSTRMPSAPMSSAMRAKLSVYQGIGHAPFFEDAPRFNAELAAFVRSAQK